MDFITKKESSYELVDSGDLMKLEKLGDFLIARPEPQAIWPKGNPDAWLKVDATYSKEGWQIGKDVPTEINFEIGGVKVQVEIGGGRNIGVFPEYVGEWQAIQKLLQTKSGAKVLNLFAHTGVSSIIAAKAGAEVVHVDASRTSNDTAKKLADENGVGDKIRFITDDALDFLKKEARRGQMYNLIIMDPPVFGRGAKGQVFKLEEQMVELLDNAKKLLSENAIGIFLNGYASEYSVLSYSNVLSVCTGMEVVSGNLCIEEADGRLHLPVGKWAFACGTPEIKDIIQKI